jgi:hypothetical protein
MRRLFAIALLVTTIGFPSAGQAQVRMGFGVSGAPWGTSSFARLHSHASASFASHRVPHHFFPSAFFLDSPFLADYPEYFPQTPAVIVVQTAPTAEAKEAAAMSAPLLIEWQGDRYVRYGGGELRAGPGNSIPVDYAAATRTAEKSGKKRAGTIEDNRDLPAVLIFRDGRREEAGSYSIIGPVMYLSSNLWTDGSWAKKIQLADLDLPATFKLNHERGVRFVLPNGPNEVVTRP